MGLAGCGEKGRREDKDKSDTQVLAGWGHHHLRRGHMQTGLGFGEGKMTRSAWGIMSCLTIRKRTD